MTAWPPPAWYPDPSGVGEQRYWNGSTWTPGVVIGGQVMEREMPWPPVRNPWETAPPPTFVPAEVDDRIHLPPRAALYALGGFVTGLVGGVALGLLAVVLDLPNIVSLLLNVAGLWAGLLGACILASRRYGTGNVLADFGLSVHLGDVGWGILLSFAARIAGAVAVIPIVAVSERLAEPDQGVFDRVEGGTGAFVAFAVVAVIGAPLVEELFFRGLLLRSLQSWIGVTWAIAVQAVLFGLAHFSPVLGLANLSLITVITAGGVIFGIVAHQRGIGRSIVAHSSFNLVTVLAVRFLLPALPA